MPRMLTGVRAADPVRRDIRRRIPAISRPHTHEAGPESCQFVEVRGREGGKVRRTGLRQPEPDDAVVLRVGPPTHETGSLGAVDQADDAVVPKEQVIGDVANGGFAAVPADCEE